MVLKTIVYYFSLTVAGAAIGLGSWHLQFETYKSIKVIGLDRIDIPGVFSGNVIDPIMLQETTKSPDFAEKVARRAGIPDLAFLLPSVTYGGQQKLTLRNLGGNPPSAIELRLSMPTAELARTAMNAVGDEIEQLQSTKTGAFLSALAKQMPQEQYAAGESRITIGNEQATLIQLALNRALIETAIKARTGYAIETAVLPPSGPSLLMAAGAIGMLCAAILFKALFGPMMVHGRRAIEKEEPVEKLAS
jgi:hypothetical protein